jgi:hypothetical protein
MLDGSVDVFFLFFGKHSFSSRFCWYYHIPRILGKFACPSNTVFLQSRTSVNINTLRAIREGDE